MYSLSSLHTFGFNCRAANLVEINSLAQAKALLADLTHAKHYILGGGSNSVFLEDFSGSIIHIAIAGKTVIENQHDYQLKVGAGESWPELVAWCLSQNMRGFENLALIPGTVGAAPIQNIGAYGVEVERFIQQVEYLCLNSGDIKTLNHQQCRFGYRDSVFKQALAGRFIIGSVTFSLPKQWVANAEYAELKALNNPTALDIFNKVIEIRQAKLPDPKKIGNAGSFFKNPIIRRMHYQALILQFPHMPHYPIDEQWVKIPAAWLIDNLGFKGKRLGGIQCHPQQPLVLTNDGVGTGQDLLALAREIKHSVLQRFAITLENEVQLISNAGLVNV